jgi:hypothetical protein
MHGGKPGRIMEEIMEREIEILSEGKNVPLNAFTRKVVLNTLMGLLTSLSGVDAQGEIRVTVKADPFHTRVV